MGLRPKAHRAAPPPSQSPPQASVTFQKCKPHHVTRLLAWCNAGGGPDPVPQPWLLCLPSFSVVALTICDSHLDTFYKYQSPGLTLGQLDPNLISDYWTHAPPPHFLLKGPTPLIPQVRPEFLESLTPSITTQWAVKLPSLAPVATQQRPTRWIQEWVNPSIK